MSYRLRTAFSLSLVLAGCSSTGSYHTIVGDSSAPGDGSISAEDGGSSGDLAGTSMQDLSGVSPGDLSTTTQPDFATPLDFATPPDFTQLPDLSVPCLPGHYSGPVTGTVTVGIALTVNGTVDFDLDPPQNGILNISNGTMKAQTSGGAGTANATFTGSVDCNTLTIANGKLSNGVATYSGLTLPFTGTVNGEYSVPAKAIINGTLTTMGLTGSGTWSANLR